MAVNSFISRYQITTSAVAMIILLLLATSLSLHAQPSHADADADFKPKPALILANRYHTDITLADYWVSEKLDGVRAYWDGQQFVSRQGNIYHAPKWFMAGFPNTPLDGELWLGRGRFDALSGAVRKQTPVDSEWQSIHFMAFDLPTAEGSFNVRLNQLQRLVDRIESPYLIMVEQQKMANTAALLKYLDEVVALGGEGLMLHLASAPYRAKRSDDLLKLKRHQDAEAVIIGYLPGKGKYEGMLGAVLVETDNGLRFKIGSGFSDLQRQTPPAIGTLITYKYFGLTGNGTPRFASFLRIRNQD